MSSRSNSRHSNATGGRGYELVGSVSGTGGGAIQRACCRHAIDIIGAAEGHQVPKSGVIFTCFPI